MQIQRSGAEQQNDPGTLRPFFVLILGALVFLGGCTAAVLRESFKDRDTRTTAESSDILDVVISTFGSEGGPLSLTMFISEPGLLLSRSELEGSTGRATLSIQGHDGYHIFFPDEGSFDPAGTSISRTSQRVVAVSMGDGRVVPGRLEVTIIG